MYYAQDSYRQNRLWVQTPSYLMQFLMFSIGALMPLISLRQGLGGAYAVFLGRVAPVDGLVVIAIVVIFLTGGIKLHVPGVFYFYALVLATTIGVYIGLLDKLSHTLTNGAAVIMAFFYLVLGYNVGRSARLAKPLLAGILVGVFWESIIILHDYFFAPQWFVDDMAGRVRGTFRASGQLGAYGFSTAGIVLALGWSLFSRHLFRALCIVAGVLCIFFVIAASRRSSMIAFCIWAMLFLIIGYRDFSNPLYLFVLLSVVVMLLFLLVFSPNIESTFVGQRFVSAVSQIGTGNSYPEKQFQSAIDHISEWFPLGMGWGQGISVDYDESNELHNGHLAVVVEAGVFGLLSFYWVSAQPIFRQWAGAFGPNTKVARALVLSFLVAAAVVMIHNTLHRDRNFMLFLGIAATLRASESASTRSE